MAGSGRRRHSTSRSDRMQPVHCCHRSATVIGNDGGAGVHQLLPAHVAAELATTMDIAQREAVRRLSRLVADCRARVLDRVRRPRARRPVASDLTGSAGHGPAERRGTCCTLLQRSPAMAFTVARAACWTRFAPRPGRLRVAVLVPAGPQGRRPPLHAAGGLRGAPAGLRHQTGTLAAIGDPGGRFAGGFWGMQRPPRISQALPSVLRTPKSQGPLIGGPCCSVVETRRIELLTFALRTRRSPS